MTITLRHADILKNGDHVHITRAELTPHGPIRCIRTTF